MCNFEVDRHGNRFIMSICRAALYWQNEMRISLEVPENKLVISQYVSICSQMIHFALILESLAILLRLICAQ